MLREHKFYDTVYGVMIGNLIHWIITLRGEKYNARNSTEKKHSYRND